MSLTKLNHEQDLCENHEAKTLQEMEYREPQSPKHELISRLVSRTEPMSYSKLKHLDSPVNFIANILKPKEKTPSMLFGSLVDCLLLEPHKFQKKFAITESTPTTDNQKKFTQFFFENVSPLDTFEDRVKEAFAHSYKRGGLEQVEHLYPYLEAVESGKEVVDEEIYQKASAVAENLQNAPEIADELAVCDEFQKFIEFDFMGWHFRGILDTYSPTLFHDLKFASDCNPEKFGRDVEKFGYDIQFGLYHIGLEILGLANDPKFKYILFDDKFNYSVAEVGEDYLYYGRKKVEHYLKRLNKMVDERGFDRSYDFFRSRTTIYKPKWIAGFDETIFEE